MKKLKEDNPYSVLGDSKLRFKHQSLLQDFEDLQEETDAMKKKLWAMKHKKMILSAEVGFLRQRYEYLKNNQISTPDPARPKLTDRRSKAPAPTQKTAPILGLKRRSEPPIGRGCTTLKSSNMDLDRGKRARGGDGLGKNNIIAPVFDLNQISREEDELQAADNLPLKVEEKKKGNLRNEGVEGDMKISICRNAANGSQRVGKRKISWQYQVALGV